MKKSDNMKQAMHEMFGVGKAPEEAKPQEVPAEKPAAPVVGRTVAATAVPKIPVSLLAEGTSFEGTLAAKGDIEIAGEFKGNVTTEGAVRLRSSIQSSISAKSVELAGCVLTGDISVSGTVAVSENSKVIGNISARDLLCAGEVVGDLKVSDSVRMDAKARVSGSIVTGSISVEKGAVISGNVQIKAPVEEQA